MKSIKNFKIGQLISKKSYVTIEGKKIKLMDSRDKILMFMSSHCVKCLKLLPELVKVNTEQRDLYLFFSADSEDCLELKNKLFWEFEVISTTESKIEKDFNVSILPYYILVNDKNIITRLGNVEIVDDLNILS